MRKKLSEQTITAWAHLVRTQQALLDKVEADLKRRDMPPLIWYDVLLELYRQQSKTLRQYEIGQRTLLRKYNLSRLLDRMEKDGLIQRSTSSSDKRGADITMTANGKRLLARMWPIYERAISDHFAQHLSSSEIYRLTMIFEKLHH